MLRLHLALCAGAPHAPSPRWVPFSQGMAQHQVSPQLHWSLWCAVPRGRCNHSVWRNNCAQRFHTDGKNLHQDTCQILLALKVHQLIKVLWLKNPIFYVIYIRCFVEIFDNFALSLYISQSWLSQQKTGWSLCYGRWE